MEISRRALLGTAAAVATVPVARRARAQANTIKIGVLNDQSGPYRDTGGPTSVICAKQAVEEFQSKGFNVEVIAADHQNKPDLGASIAREWYDREGVDLIIDVPTSSVALAIAGVSKEKNKVHINVGAATSDLTGKSCSPTLVHYCYDTYMLAKSTGGATVKAGGDSWYFITADYAFGQQLQKDTTAFVTAAGGKVLGSSPYPFPGTTDFSSFLLQAQSSGAKVLGLCNAGGDTVNSIKQAKEFGIKMRLAAMLMFVTDVNALGLDAAQGLVLTESFYWDLNDRTRAFTNRVKAKTPNNWPNMIHAGNYSGTLHFLKAVADMGVAEAKKSGAAIVERMKKMPVDDDCFQGSIRVDGRGMFPSYLFEVKKPSESKGKWDYFKTLVTTPADQAWRPLNEGGCYFVTA
ncbi:ABC transporter substrate-binding protein [Limobrevibacterium gyesilva]|uniref:ABC transporter substrate-binding protein n=1 Tax=Limobrevibacterium gyesilva TaxID=2991712 RepID=A0AA42CHS2_9PROT|nr:ABC transporter substrate-binding protein [Limobrevibacterium gyesilva]MCW3475175.1 ABC transporter substrate-binding protein [Limobrevibacterium gyesilva]